MIGIVRPNSGNITSICDALERLEQPYRLLPEPNLFGIERLILPGQGRFGALMAFLRKSGWDEALCEWWREGRPFLGICVGMQVLFERSEEDPESSGLGLLNGDVRQLRAPKTPMVGWAEIEWRGHPLANSGGDRPPELPVGAAYFVNRFVVPESEVAFGHCSNGETFVAAVRRASAWACQFHPEKSGIWGKEFINVWLAETSDSLS